MHKQSHSELLGCRGVVPYMYYDKPGLVGRKDLNSNFLVLKSKKHVKPELKNEKIYLFHTKIVKSSRGGLVNSKKCMSEFSLESLLGTKHRIKTLDQQRNNLNYRSLGDKNYMKPEHSPEFFKKSTVFSDSYGPPKKFDRRSIKEQLGPVDGIFSKIMKIQSERALNLKEKYFKPNN